MFPENMITDDDSLDRWLTFVEMYEKAYEYGLSVTRQPRAVPRRSASPSSATVMTCAPHPDDELLTGALCLRLMREGRARVIDVALTLGSNPDRQGGRLRELEHACDTIGFDLVADDIFFSKNTPDRVKEERLCSIMADLKPDIVLFPHDREGHRTHEETHRLVRAALKCYSRKAGSELLVVETEFWQQMLDGNFLLGIDKLDLARLINALTCHAGEIARHAYHLLLPARMMDTVRRASEVVGGFGGERAEFLFGELYRVSKLEQGAFLPCPQRVICGPGEPITLDRMRSLFEI